MSSDELKEWFGANKHLLENAYIAGEQPWQQSRFGLHGQRTYEQWEALRHPVAERLDRSGTFLDIGCANGYLLECVMRWAAERDLEIIPYGLDFSEKLVALAQQRLPRYTQNIFVGNAWDWTPPITFDYVRTELVYVPEDMHKEYITRILRGFLKPGGKLLLAEYRGRTIERPLIPKPLLSIDQDVADLGFAVESVRSGFWAGLEQTRIAVLKAAS